MKLKNVEELVKWAAQQGYVNWSEAAEEVSKITGKVLVLDQAYYNNYKWVNKEEEK